jgi:hypothetical protein
MNTDTYLQFPLCALAFGNDERERLEHIISYGLIEAGFSLLRKMPPAIRQQKLASYRQTPSDYDSRKDAHQAAILGFDAIGVSCLSIKSTIARWNALRAFLNEFEGRYGRDAEVRLRKDLVFECRDKQGISYRELTLLAALYSIIGRKAYPVRVTRTRLRCRMMGYKSFAVMDVELPKRTDGIKPISLRQIGYTLDALHERRFFARARANARQTFYSNRLAQVELEAALFKSKTYADTFHQQRQKRDAALMQRIKAARGTIKANASIKVDTSDGDGSNSVHSASASASAGVSAECSL